jgi:hypothetical protein
MTQQEDSRAVGEVWRALVHGRTTAFIPPKAPADRFWRELAAQDWILLVYLVGLVSCALAGHGPRRTTAIAYSTIDLAAFFGALLVARTRAVRPTVRALVYRGGVVAAILGSFAHLEHVLPTARSTVLDAELYSLDVKVFGFEPAEAFDRIVTPLATEWFSFFYLAYFFIVALHIVPLFTAKSPRLLAELSLGLVVVFCFGHLLYVAVPGHGPYRHLSDHFERPLDGPLFWRLLMATIKVVDVSARTDIFPSLHTAAPTFLALFAVRHRRSMPFRFTWLPLAVTTSQIIVSTMYLRWHYLADVLAGLCLALLAFRASTRMVAWEAARRARRCREAVWTVVS